MDASGVGSNLVAMNDAQRHRGPDDEGYAYIRTRENRVVEIAGADTPASYGLKTGSEEPVAEFGLALASRRLAVLDLSQAGHMPMSYGGGRYWMAYNGEVYNYREIRQDLSKLGHEFHSDTDTETILAAYAEWGVECLSRLNGMFAFALWDGVKRRLFCARDRLGIKPFYYSFSGGRFVFGSEIKSILLDDRVRKEPNDARVFDYLAAWALRPHQRHFFRGRQGPASRALLSPQPRRDRAISGQVVGLGDQHEVRGGARGSIGGRRHRRDGRPARRRSPAAVAQRRTGWLLPERRARFLLHRYADQSSVFGRTPTTSRKRLASA